ncbi:MAG: hypothetical protein K0R57_2061 [Paenibacillaceae bacterium]|nr:hypothetical protein [Paenibacillaceae bacterium]
MNPGNLDQPQQWSQSGRRPLPVLLDVDTGTDDTLALLYALLSGEADIVGITTAVGNVSAEQATVNTLKVLDAAGADESIPVAKGAEHPLVRSWPGTKRDFHGDNGLGNYELPASSRLAVEEPAADFLIRQVKEREGELTLIFLGRLTNLAVALQQDPALAKKVKQLVIMGGALRVPGNINHTAEANIHGDPEAADIVFRSGIPLTMVGLDVTTKTLLGEKHLERLLREAARPDDPVIDLARHLLGFRMQAYLNRKGIHASPMHDPLAVAIALDPQLAVAQSVYVAVDTVSETELGATKEVPATAGSLIRVCTEVDADAFLDRFIQVLTRKRASVPFTDKRSES